jgi:predicted glycoside hydrolase/deacetylase ChbG (UPF0249 family)
VADAGAPTHRRIWLCADDYGLSPGVNRGIRDLIARRRINATSVMMVAPGSPAAEMATLAAIGAADHAVGLHLTLTAPFRPVTAAFRPVAADGGFLPLPAMFARGLMRQLDPGALGDEAAAQVAAFRAACGRPPDFIDGHQHVHLLPQVTDALLAVMADAAPDAWVRQCGRASRRLSDAKGHLIDFLSARLRRRCAARGVRSNPSFAGTYDFARPGTDYAALFEAFVEGLPDGGLVMCHPGFVDAQLQRLDPLTDMREREYEFFVGDRFVALMASRGLALASRAGAGSRAVI